MDRLGPPEVIVARRAYDIVLLHAWSRVHNHFLNIIRHLSARLRIGVCHGAVVKQVKNPETEKRFLELCRKLGAELFEELEFDCGLLVIPQFEYKEGYLASLMSSSRARSQVVVQTFGHGAVNLAALSAQGLKRLLVYDLQVFEQKLETEEERRFVHDRFELVEMGSPFVKHPVFEEPRTDYLVAFPTDLSLLDTAHKAQFVHNVVKLLGEIPPSDQVLVKLHNVSDGGRLPERSQKYFEMGYQWGRRASWIPPWRLPGAVGNVLADVTFGAGYRTMLDRGSALEDLTPDYNLGLELFMPCVKKGVITGRSTVSWHALVNDIPVYNCDDEVERARADAVLLNHRLFGVPPCHGRLTFDPASFRKIADSTRKADLLQVLEQELSR